MKKRARRNHSPAFKAKVALLQSRAIAPLVSAEGRETTWTDQYMRMHLRFETGAESYGWLNESLLAEGRQAGGARD